MGENLTKLQQANIEFKEKNYMKSLELLREAKKNLPALKSIIDFNIDLIQRRLQKNSPKVYVVVGLPRSGLTLLGCLLNAHSQLNTWFFPYSTQADSSNEPLKSLSDMQERFYDKYSKEGQDYSWVLVDSMAHEGASDWLKESVNNLQSSCEVDVELIWIVREPSQTYLSFVDACKKYWGNSDLEISSDHFKQYVESVKHSFKSLYSLGFDNDFLFVSYEKLVQSPGVVLKQLMPELGLSYEASQLDYNLNFPSYKMAGDPYLCENPQPVFSKSVYQRKTQWEKHQHLVDELDQKNSELFQELTDLDGMLLNKDILHKKEFIDDMVRKAFDEEFYLEQYSDVKKSNINPLTHFLNHGWKEQRQPNRAFNTTAYFMSYQNLSVNPIVHNHFIGRFEDPSTLVQKMEGLDILDPETYRITEDLVLIADKHDEPLVSIIIPAYNQEKYTLACIETIIKHTKDIPYEIIVMDDKSPSESARSIDKHLKNITFHSNEENQGFLKNCNKGVEFANGKYILFLNNDTNVQPNWLSSLVELIESDETIGMVGSRLVYPNGLQQEAGGIIWNDASGWNFGRLDDPGKPEYNYVKEVDYISGAAIMLSRQLWDQIGGFDRRFIPAYFEDSDLAFEVRNHGYKVMYQPKSIVVHFEGISHGTDLGSGIKSYQVKNRQKFIDKWKIELAQQHDNAQDVFLARDRSKNKKHILFIDHYVPHFDQDAGSRTVYGYIKLFVDSGYKVTFIGDNYYPHQPYTGLLQQLGVEVFYGAWYAEHWQEWIEENGKHLDYVFLNRPHISERYMPVVSQYVKGKVIYYGHDLHYLRDYREFELTGNYEKKKSSEEWLKREFALMNASDLAFYPSQVEVNEITSIDSSINVRALPAYIFESFYSSRRDIKETKDIMFVGGFGHQPNVDAVKWFANEIWPFVQNVLPELKFYIVGSKPSKEVLALQSDNIIVTGFVTDEELSDYYKKCRIAVVPLRYGAGIKGKVVEALYNAIPIVTTSIGSEGLEDAEQYMQIKDKAIDMVQAIVDLYDNHDALTDLSNKGQIYCKRYFSYNTVKNVLGDVFDFTGQEK